MNSGNKHLIEATSQPYWGCCLRKSVASHINTNYLPGQNMLGELLVLRRKTKKTVSKQLLRPQLMKMRMQETTQNYDRK